MQSKAKCANINLAKERGLTQFNSPMVRCRLKSAATQTEVCVKRTAFERMPSMSSKQEFAENTAFDKNAVVEKQARLNVLQTGVFRMFTDAC